MGKVKANAVDGFTARPDPACRVILVYGPDTGRISEVVKALTVKIAGSADDPFSVVDLTAKTVLDDPARLTDECAAIAMFGGRRVVRLNDATDSLTPALKALGDPPPGDAVVLLQAGDLGPRSSLRLWCEDMTAGTALPCYIDEGRDLQGVIVETLRSHGLTADGDALAFLLAHLGADRLITRMELEKLSLYMGGPGRVGLDDVAACVGDSTAQGLDDLVFAVADGDIAVSQRLLDRLRGEGVASIAILRAVARHFMRLHFVAGAVAGGKSLDVVMNGLKPKVFFKRSDAFKRQTRNWTAERLAVALDLLQTAEQDCKTTGFPEAEICSRAMIQIGRAAGRAR